MPYFPPESDFKSITLTLHSGETVTLVEKQLSAGDRKAMTKRALTIQYDFRFKQKQAELIDGRIEKALTKPDLKTDHVYVDGLDRTAFDEAANQAIELMSGVSLAEVYATVLEMRFASWDVYASKADFDAQKPVEMSKAAITEFAESKPQNAALLEEIMELLKAHDEGREKKDGPTPAITGNGSMTARNAQ